ncbi:hypothetical protein H4582DRAFT_2057302 [Lactarius indigo]|nr:hypothetical protein H4582DRAFT_2057302 [Lactarius indigo]
MQSTAAESIKEGPSLTGKVTLSQNSPQLLLMIARTPFYIDPPAISLAVNPLTQWFIRTSPGVSTNAEGSLNKDGIAQSGANGQSSVANNGTDPAAVAALKKEIERFVERGEGSKPVVGRQIFPNPSRQKTTSQPSGTGKSRPLPQTSTDKSTKQSQK